MSRRAVPAHLLAGVNAVIASRTGRRAVALSDGGFVIPSPPGPWARRRGPSSAALSVADRAAGVAASIGLLTPTRGVGLADSAAPVQTAHDRRVAVARKALGIRTPKARP